MLRPQNSLERFEIFQRFVVTFSIEVMLQSRINGLRKQLVQFVDLFRDLAQSGEVFCLVAAALLVVNDREALSQSFS